MWEQTLTGPMMRSRSPHSLLLKTLFPLLIVVNLGCLEVRHSLDLNDNGSGRASFEMRIDRTFLMEGAVAQLKATAEKDGWTLRSERDEGGKLVLTLDRHFTKCSELSDSTMRYDCGSGLSRDFRRVQLLRIEQLKGLDVPVPVPITITARMPGRMEYSTGDITEGGLARWSGSMARGNVFAAASSSFALPSFAAMSTLQKLLAGVALLAALIATGGLVWLALRLPARLRSTRRFCTACGHALKPVARFCPACGVALPARGLGPRPSLVAPLLLAGGGGLAFAGTTALFSPRLNHQATIENLVEELRQGKLLVAQAHYLGGPLFASTEADLRKAVGDLDPAGTVEVREEQIVRDSGTVTLTVANREGTRRVVRATLERARAGWRVRDWDSSAKPLGWDRAEQGSRLCAGPTREQAVAEFQAATKESPADARIVTELANCYMRLEDLDSAEREYKRAIGMYPEKLWYPYLNIAVVYQRKGDFAQAEQALRQAIKNNPNPAIAYNNLAWMLADQGAKLDEAVALAEKAVSLGTGGVQATYLYTLGWVHYKKADRAQAIKYLEEAFRKDPNHTLSRALYEELTTTVEDLLARAQSLRQAGQYEQAIASYDAALRKDASNSAAQQGRTDAVAEGAAAHLGRAEALLGRQRYDEALAECDLALQLSPQNAAALDLKRRIAETKRILGY
jgi:tetratricopeptide (TPR) repeat protein